MCSTGASAQSQADSFVSYMQSHGMHNGGTGSGTYGTVWLDIEGTQYWGSTSTNQAFFTFGFPVGFKDSWLIYLLARSQTN